jgi:uncharacterized protein YecE (DUF72 family)
MSRRLRVGTASWTDPTLVKESDWYPRRSMSAEARLRFYASVFTMVEADATYYHPPTQKLAGLWVDRTPQDFRFDVKAYGLLTKHPARRDSLWGEVAEALPPEHADKRNIYLEHLPKTAQQRAFDLFAEALRPLESAGRLGAVFFQLPPWFVASRANRAFLESLPDRLGDLPIAVEFRHRSWMDGDTAPRTLALLEQRGMTYVCVDAPQGFDSSVPPVLAVTSALAVIRFHGHNAENWDRKGITAAERFRYLYSDDELAQWAPRVADVAAQARETHAVFNNCYADYGVRNARQLAGLLDEGIQEDAPESTI